MGRAIAAAFESEPDNAFTTKEPCERAYPSTEEGPSAYRKQLDLETRGPNFPLSRLKSRLSTWLKRFDQCKPQKPH